MLYLCTRNTTTGCSAVRLAHLVWDQRVPGSNPGTPTKEASKEMSFDISFVFGIHTIFLRRNTQIIAITLSLRKILLYLQ